MINTYVGEGADGSPKPSHRERDTSKLSSPSFAPRGQPKSRIKFRQRLPPPLRLAIPQNKAVEIIHDTCSVGHAHHGVKQIDVIANVFDNVESCQFEIRQSRQR
jgi:hypothetical protein